VKIEEAFLMQTADYEIGPGTARRLDEKDELASFREAFIIDDPELIYLDGNSLGRLTKRATNRLKAAVEVEWGSQLVRGWNRDWYQAPGRAGEKIARLIGAEPGQVIVSDSTSVNLFKLVMAALALKPGRTGIVSDDLNFPSDLYILQGCIQLLGNRHHLQLVPSRDGVHGDLEAISNALNENTALLTLSHVTFKSGFLYDVEEITRRAHEAGALVLWDLSHSVGAIPISLDRWGADLAVGCTYKYLNGGPGAPAFLYVRRELQERAKSPIWGWFGQQNPFSFGLQYQHADGMARWLAGTPPILSLLAMEVSLDVVIAAGVPAIRRKSRLLTSYLVFLVDRVLAPLDFSLGSPRQAEQRGSHVSIRHPEGYRINRALIQEMQVLPDFRDPDNIRLGLSPLYTSFGEVWEAVDRIRRVVEERRYASYPAERLTVT
jgi:kynureninase